MRTTKSIIIAGVTAFILFFGIILGVNATNDPVKKTEPKTLTYDTWYFTGSTTAEALDPNKYSPNPVSTKPCGTTPQIACRILAPDNGSGKPDLDEMSADGNPISDEIHQANTNLTVNSTVKAFRTK